MSESWEDASPIRPVSNEAGAAPDLKKARRQKTTYPDLKRTDRLPPNAPEAEQGVLGCILLAPNECIAQCIEKLKSPDDFYDLRHQTIYTYLVMMYDERTPIDIITLQQRLKDWALLDEVGGIPYLNSLQDTVPSAANLTYYLDIVSEKALLRRTVNFCTEFAGRIYDFEGEADELMDEFERDATAISERKVNNEAKPIAEFVSDANDTIDAMSKRGGEGVGLKTGYSDLDRILMGGMKDGDMIVIAARPSIGKTSLLMNILENIAVAGRIPVGVFSLEMTSALLTLRMICTRSRVNLEVVANTGVFTDEDTGRAANASVEINRAPLYIDDTPGLSILQLRSRARRMVQRYGIKVLGVDYLQLLKSFSKQAQLSRQVEISEISAGIKALAKELGIPVIVLAQLNRDIEKDKSRKPRLSDLRESGSIEQDADVVGLLYKPDAEEEGTTNQNLIVPTNLLIAKQRNGRTGDVRFTFFKGITRFELAARVNEQDVPQTRQPEPEQTGQQEFQDETNPVA